MKEILFQKFGTSIPKIQTISKTLTGNIKFEIFNDGLDINSLFLLSSIVSSFSSVYTS